MSPCGRIVECLRSCYTADFVFYDGDPTRNKVIWYWVPDDRKFMPFGHSFGSRIYDRDELDEPTIGEQFSPVPWRGGQAPCPEPLKGLCGTEEEWERGLDADRDPVEAWPHTLIPKCCPLPLIGCCGGIAIGRFGFGACHMESTCDIYSPFGAVAPAFTNVPIQFVEDLLNGRGSSPNNTVAWTHYIDVAQGVVISDGVTRTASLNTLDYADGDEVRIPTGGGTRYVVVWVTLCDTEGTVVKRVFLMRHSP